MSARTRSLLLAFAALGAIASTWSSYVHYALLTRPGYSSFCDVSGTVSCTQAYLSEYGSVFGIPVALAGVLFFTVVLLAVGPGGRLTVRGRDNVPGYVFLMSVAGLAVVLYLAWASFFRLNAVCMLCVATYVAVIGLFIVSGAATSFPLLTLPARAAGDLSRLLRSPAALVLTLACSIGFVMLVSAFPREVQAVAEEEERAYPPLTDGQRFQFLQWYDVQPRVDLPVDAQGAKVSIVKFNDFQCPACRETYLGYRGILRQYTASGQVRSVVKHFPLEPECNAAVPGGNHRAACEAAAAMVMAGEKGLGDEMEAWLFANQSTLTKESIVKGVEQVAGITDFEARYAPALKQVREDADLGARLEVHSTPTYFINGRKIANLLPPPYLEAAIEHELKKQP